MSRFETLDKPSREFSKSIGNYEKLFWLFFKHFEMASDMAESSVLFPL